MIQLPRFIFTRETFAVITIPADVVMLLSSSETTEGRNRARSNKIIMDQL